MCVKYCIHVVICFTQEEAERLEQAKEAEYEQRRKAEEMAGMEEGDPSDLLQQPPPQFTHNSNNPSLSDKFAEEMKY